MSVSTLHLVNITLHLTAGLALIIADRSFRGGAALGLWGLSNLLYALGFITNGWTHWEWQPLARNLGGNLLIDLGSGVAFCSLHLFLGAPRRLLWLLLPAAGFALAKVGVFLTIGLHLPVNVVLGCLCRLILTTGSAWMLFRQKEVELRPAAWSLAGFQLAWAAILIWRVAWELGMVIPGGLVKMGDLGGDPTTPLALLLRICITFSLTLGYLWMIGRRLEARLIQQAAEDPLTGIVNRRMLWERGERLVARARQQGIPVAALMIDVDHFKSVNDRWGHAAGDRLLIGVARTLADAIRPTDILGRVGGEEFAVILPDAPAGVAAAVAERARQAVAGLRLKDGSGPPACTVSIGYAVLSANTTWEGLVDQADQAMYRAKKAGRNRVEAFAESAPTLDDATGGA